jgi:hypothetical protein
MFLKLDSNLHWTAPNHPTGSKSACAVEGEIECAWNVCGADQYQAGAMHGDVLHNTIGGASVSKQLGRLEHSGAMDMSSFVHIATIGATD